MPSIGRIRNRAFFGLEELNAAIGKLLVRLNNRPFQKLEGRRRSAFESIDRPAMKALPATRWQYVEHKKARVNINYHVELDGRLYSAPYTLVREVLDLRFTASVVELFHRGKRVATHARLWSPKGSASTQQEHRPKHHRDYGEWSPSRLIAWAATKGTDVGALVEHILHEKLADPTIADAICDRVTHNAHVIGLRGPSIREKKGMLPAQETTSL